jgi:hypothetical protein
VQNELVIRCIEDTVCYLYRGKVCKPNSDGLFYDDSEKRGCTKALLTERKSIEHIFQEKKPPRSEEIVTLNTQLGAIHGDH